MCDWSFASAYLQIVRHLLQRQGQRYITNFTNKHCNTVRNPQFLAVSLLFFLLLFFLWNRGPECLRKQTIHSGAVTWSCRRSYRRFILLGGVMAIHHGIIKEYDKLDLPVILDIRMPTVRLRIHTNIINLRSIVNGFMLLNTNDYPQRNKDLRRVLVAWMERNNDYFGIYIVWNNVNVIKVTWYSWNIIAII